MKNLRKGIVVMNENSMVRQGEKDERNIIYSFTRKDAIETGVLVDASTVAKKAGVKLPTAITSNV